MTGSDGSYALGTVMAAGAGSPLSSAPDTARETPASAPGAPDMPSNSSIDAAFLAGRLSNADNAKGISKGAVAALCIIVLMLGSFLITVLVCTLAPCARKHRRGKAWQERRTAGEMPYKASVLSV